MSLPKPPPEPEKDEFMVLFTALSMILLAFFVMLNSLATIDDGRKRVVVDSLVGTFGFMPGYKYRNEQVQPGDRAVLRNKKDVDEMLEETFGLIEAQHQRGLSVERRADGRIIVRMDSEVFFKPAHVHVSPLSFPTLDRIARLIVRTRIPVRIEGHTDATPFSGGRSNWYLSGARAAAVFRYLQEAGGVPVGLMSAAGYADTRPPTEEGVSPRRVELVFLPRARRVP